MWLGKLERTRKNGGKCQFDDGQVSTHFIVLVARFAARGTSPCTRLIGNSDEECYDNKWRRSVCNLNISYHLWFYLLFHLHLKIKLNFYFNQSMPTTSSSVSKWSISLMVISCSTTSGKIDSLAISVSVLKRPNPSSFPDICKRVGFDFVLRTRRWVDFFTLLTWFT